MRYTLLGIVLAAAGVMAGAVPAVAHHGAATFDTGKEITLKGVVTEWIWANPHCFLKFDAKDETGTVRQWAVETQNPVAMTSRGWSRSAFKAGDEVTVRLEPVKNGAPVGRVLSVVLPNGQMLVAVGPQPAAPVQ
ncbi:MAG: DUF6152 family protein [Vicinamibacterales bacterium]